MYSYLVTAIAAIAVPFCIFAWMMGVAALALLTNGENPRAVLAMPRTFWRGGKPVAVVRDDALVKLHPSNPQPRTSDPRRF